VCPETAELAVPAVQVTKPTLTIHRSVKDENSGTAMLVCPGGGYWNLYWQLESEVWLDSLSPVT